MPTLAGFYDLEIFWTLDISLVLYLSIHITHVVHTGWRDPPPRNWLGFPWACKHVMSSFWMKHWWKGDTVITSLYNVTLVKFNTEPKHVSNPHAFGKSRCGPWKMRIVRFQPFHLQLLECKLRRPIFSSSMRSPWFAICSFPRGKAASMRSSLLGVVEVLEWCWWMRWDAIRTCQHVETQRGRLILLMEDKVLISTSAGFLPSTV